MLNYIIEKCEFPANWTIGSRSAVHKSGTKSIVDNYRGITILPVMEKIFEIAAYRRLCFANEVCDEIDRYNGGFLEGCQTTDNMFILRGLIEKQMVIGKSLYVCFIDFSKAFDLINRNILFNKLMHGSWRGKVTDTLRDLYNKTSFRVKRNGRMSPSICNNIGVNQGGVASGFLFRKYMADLGRYLDKEVGVCVSAEILVHLLWADDLILFSDSPRGLQKQLDGLKSFCADNHMIVNETKSKVMCFGKQTELNVYFNDKKIEQVSRYKYLGNIVKCISRKQHDIFSDNYQYLCDQARKAPFGIRRKTRTIGILPPPVMFYIFDALIKPITTYGSDVWGACSSGVKSLDKVFLNFMRCVLQVKATTCNTIVYGECGRLPPSVYCNINVICFMHRLQYMPMGSLVKYVFNELESLHQQGFNTWVTKVTELTKLYGIVLHGNFTSFKSQCKSRVIEHFLNDWKNELNSEDKPILRTYRMFKHNFESEKYLHNVLDDRYRTAIAKLRTSSHVLEIERGRHAKPKIATHLRTCTVCHTIEDEDHFVTACEINESERKELHRKIENIYPLFKNMNERQMFLYLMSNKDR